MNTEMPKGLESEQETVFEEIRREVADFRKNEVTNGEVENHGDSSVDNNVVEGDAGDNVVESDAGDNVVESDAGNDVVEDNNLKSDNKEKEDESKIGVNASVTIGDIFFQNGYNVASKYPGMLAGFDFYSKNKNLNDKGIRVGLFAAEAYNFRPASKDDPAGSVSVLDPYMSYSFGKDKNLNFSAGTQFAFLHNDYELNQIVPHATFSCNKDGTIASMSFLHQFMKGPDTNIFRAEVTKELNEVFKATGAYITEFNKNLNVDKRSGAVVLEAKISDSVSVVVRGKMERDHNKKAHFIPSGGFIFWLRGKK